MVKIHIINPIKHMDFALVLWNQYHLPHHSKISTKISKLMKKLTLKDPSMETYQSGLSKVYSYLMLLWLLRTVSQILMQNVVGKNSQMKWFRWSIKNVLELYFCCGENQLKKKQKLSTLPNIKSSKQLILPHCQQARVSWLLLTSLSAMNTWWALIKSQ